VTDQRVSRGACRARRGEKRGEPRERVAPQSCRPGVVTQERGGPQEEIEGCHNGEIGEGAQRGRAGEEFFPAAAPKGGELKKPRGTTAGGEGSPRGAALWVAKERRGVGRTEGC